MCPLRGTHDQEDHRTALFCERHQDFFWSSSNHWTGNENSILLWMITSLSLSSRATTASIGWYLVWLLVLYFRSSPPGDFSSTEGFCCVPCKVTRPSDQGLLSLALSRDVAYSSFPLAIWWWEFPYLLLDRFNVTPLSRICSAISYAPKITIFIGWISADSAIGSASACSRISWRRPVLRSASSVALEMNSDIQGRAALAEKCSLLLISTYCARSAYLLVVLLERVPRDRSLLTTLGSSRVWCPLWWGVLRELCTTLASTMPFVCSVLMLTFFQKIISAGIVIGVESTFVWGQRFRPVLLRLWRWLTTSVSTGRSAKFETWFSRFHFLYCACSARVSNIKRERETYTAFPLNPGSVSSPCRCRGLVSFNSNNSTPLVVIWGESCSTLSSCLCDVLDEQYLPRSVSCWPSAYFPVSLQI